MTEFTGFPQPGYTAIPNELLDTFLPILGEAELRVALFVARKTFGWHKRDDDLSLGQIAKGTGLSKPAVVTATASLVERGLLIKRTRGQNLANNYRLNIQTSKATLPDEASQATLPPQTSKATLPEVVNEVNPPSKAALPEVVKQVNTQKKLNKPVKETERKGGAASAAPPPPPSKPVVSEPTPASPKRPGRAAKETPEETAYYAACVPVVARACRIDLKVPGEWARCKKPLQALYHATVRPTPDLIALHYEMPAGYWYTRDFRGQKGETPEPHWIQNTWGKAVSATPTPPNGNGHARAAPMTRHERNLRVLEEHERRSNGGADPPPPPGTIDGRVIRYG